MKTSVPDNFDNLILELQQLRLARELKRIREGDTDAPRRARLLMDAGGPELLATMQVQVLAETQ